MDSTEEIKSLEFVGSSHKDILDMPEAVKGEFGYALYLAQLGSKAENVKVLTGFGGAGVLEVRDNYDGDTYRAVYTVRFAEVIYVLHVFKKKSHVGNATDKSDIELIKSRLADATALYEERKTKK